MSHPCENFQLPEQITNYLLSLMLLFNRTYGNVFFQWFANKPIYRLWILCFFRSGSFIFTYLLPLLTVVMLDVYNVLNNDSLIWSIGYEQHFHVFKYMRNKTSTKLVYLAKHIEICNFLLLALILTFIK